MNDGRRDRDRNKKYKFGSAYKHSDNGYRSEYGDKNAYRQQYQSGYSDGYNRGYQQYGQNGRQQSNGEWRLPR